MMGFLAGFALLIMGTLGMKSASASVSPAACERLLMKAETNLFRYENRIRTLLSQLHISPATLDSQQILETQGLRVALEQQLNLVRSAASGVSQPEVETRVPELEERIRKLKVDAGRLLTQLAGSSDAEGVGEGALGPWTAALAEALSDLQPLQKETLQEMARGLLEDGTATDDIVGLAQTYRVLSVHSWLGEGALAQLAVHFWQNRRPPAVNDGLTLIGLAQQLSGRKKSFEGFLADYIGKRFGREVSVRDSVTLALEIAREGGTPSEDDVAEFFELFKALRSRLVAEDVDTGAVAGLVGVAWRMGWRQVNLDDLVLLMVRIADVFGDLERRRHFQLAQSLLQGNRPTDLEDLTALRQEMNGLLDSTSALHTLVKGLARGHSGAEIRDVFLLGRRMGEQLKNVLRSRHQDAAELVGVRLAELFFKVPYDKHAEDDLLAYFRSIYQEINEIDDSALQAAHMSKSVWSAVDRGDFFPGLSAFERARKVAEIYSAVSRFRHISRDGALRLSQAVIRAGGTSEVVDEARKLFEENYGRWMSEDGVRAVLNSLRRWARRRATETSFDTLESP